jgi:small nuclear ribonucleoprotein (snRNP)-like protein
VGKSCAVKLKWGMEYRGTLVATDAYMNLQLSGADEWIDGAHAGTLGVRRACARSRAAAAAAAAAAACAALLTPVPGPPSRLPQEILIRCNNVLYIRADAAGAAAAAAAAAAPAMVEA